MAISPHRIAITDRKALRKGCRTPLICGLDNRFIIYYNLFGYFKQGASARNAITML